MKNKVIITILVLLCTLTVLEKTGLLDKFLKSEYGWIIEGNTNPYNHTDEDMKYYVSNDGRLIPKTELSEDDLKRQEEEGCIPCHKE